MADKEATVYVVDVGKSMAQKHGGRKQSDLDWTMLYIWDKITTVMSWDRKSTLQGVVGLKTNESENDLAEEESFEHISVLQELNAIQLADLKRLQDVIVPSDTDQGDAISALVVAINMVVQTCKKLKYKRRIILVTNGCGAYDDDQLGDIVEKLKEDAIELVILGVDFDDPDYGFIEANKSTGKAKNESLLKSLAADADGSYGTLAEAIEELTKPRLKRTRPIASYKGEMLLGWPQDKDNNTLHIQVERYPRTMIRKPPAASKVTKRLEQGNTQLSTTLMEDVDDNHLASSLNGDYVTRVRDSRAYYVLDDREPGGKKYIEPEDRAIGYEYGSSLVPVSGSDESTLQLETKAGLELIGFVPWDKFDRQMAMSQSCVIIGERHNTKAVMALSSVIHALHEVESYGIGRLVMKENKKPLLLLLAPSIEPDFECLVDVQLPFAEDVRTYEFPSLDKIFTITGKELKEHAKLPSKELQKAMSDYVDRMDLTTLGTDEEGNPAEYARMEDTFSPTFHRIDQAIRWRAAHGSSKPIPPPNKILTKYSKPPAELVNGAERQLKKLVAIADIKKVPHDTKARKRRANELENHSGGLDIDAIMRDSEAAQTCRLTRVNPIPGFKQYLIYSHDPERWEIATAQFGEIIENRVRESFGGISYNRALEEMGVFREEAEEMQRADTWNAWLRQFKIKLVQEELGGDRAEFWYEVRKEKLGLVFEDPRGRPTKEERAKALTRFEEEANNFWRLR